MGCSKCCCVGAVTGVLEETHSARRKNHIKMRVLETLAEHEEQTVGRRELAVRFPRTQLPNISTTLLKLLLRSVPSAAMLLRCSLSCCGASSISARLSMVAYKVMLLGTTIRHDPVAQVCPTDDTSKTSKVVLPAVPPGRVARPYISDDQARTTRPLGLGLPKSGAAVVAQPPSGISRLATAKSGKHRSASPGINQAGRRPFFLAPGRRWLLRTHLCLAPPRHEELIEQTPYARSTPSPPARSRSHGVRGGKSGSPQAGGGRGGRERPSCLCLRPAARALVDETWILAAGGSEHGTQ